MEPIITSEACTFKIVAGIVLSTLISTALFVGIPSLHSKEKVRPFLEAFSRMTWLFSWAVLFIACPLIFYWFYRTGPEWLHPIPGDKTSCGGGGFVIIACLLSMVLSAGMLIAPFFDWYKKFP